MINENLARLRAHRNNIHRYRKLLNTQLSELERVFVLKRFDEEQTALQELSNDTVRSSSARVLPLRRRTKKSRSRGGRAAGVPEGRVSTDRRSGMEACIQDSL
jgi:hypothetical protein